MRTFADRKRRSARWERAAPAQTSENTGGIAELQRTAGNRAVASMLSAPGATQQTLQRWFAGFRLPSPARTSPGRTATCSLEGGGFAKGTSFPIESFHWGSSQAHTSRQSESPRIESGGPKDFAVVKRVDALSTRLSQAAATGKRIDKVTIVLTDGSTTVTYEFENVYVSSVQSGGSGGDAVPVEEVMFNFQSVSYDRKE